MRKYRWLGSPCKAHLLLLFPTPLHPFFTRWTPPTCISVCCISFASILCHLMIPFISAAAPLFLCSSAAPLFFHLQCLCPPDSPHSDLWLQGGIWPLRRPFLISTRHACAHTHRRVDEDGAHAGEPDMPTCMSPICWPNKPYVGRFIPMLIFQNN